VPTGKTHEWLWRGAFCAAVLAGTFFWAFVAVRVAGQPGGDFSTHAMIARNVKVQGRPVPHPLYQWTMIAVQRAHPSWHLAACGVVVVTVFHAFLFALLQKMAAGALGHRPSLAAASLSVAASLAVTVTNPINWLRPSEPYFGYIFSNTFHNPTALLLRPLALALFFLSLRVLSRPTWPDVAGCAALTVLSALAKPSHLICFLPALGLLLLFRGTVREGGQRLRAMILGVFAPAFLVLAWQLWVLSTLGRRFQSPIVWSPFEAVFVHTEPDLLRLLAKALLSILFPLVVLLAYREEARRDESLKLAWISLLFAVLYGWGFAESGPRLAHGNFLWSAQIAAFILFVVSLLFFLRRAAASNGRGLRTAFCTSVFLLHLASGAMYAWEYARWGRFT